MWGSGGWHFVSIDASLIMLKIRDNQALAREFPGGGETRCGIFEPYGRLAHWWEANGERYLGTDLAWERCPAYMAAVRGRAG